MYFLKLAISSSLLEIYFGYQNIISVVKTPITITIYRKYLKLA
jgi:hypothetical protein